jgi:hypothetical protein
MIIEHQQAGPIHIKDAASCKTAYTRPTVLCFLNCQICSCERSRPRLFFWSISRLHINLYRSIKTLSDTLHFHVKYDLGRQMYLTSSRYYDTTLQKEPYSRIPKRKLYCTSLDTDFPDIGFTADPETGITTSTLWLHQPQRASTLDEAWH